LKPPWGLKFKGRLVVLLCRAALPFLRDPERIEAMGALRQNYEALLGWGR